MTVPSDEGRSTWHFKDLALEVTWHLSYHALKVGAVTKPSRLKEKETKLWMSVWQEYRRGNVMGHSVITIFRKHNLPYKLFIHSTAFIKPLLCAWHS